MSLFKKLFGADDAKPEMLDNIEAVANALDLIARERAIAADTRRDLIQKRHEALAADATDKQIAAIDSEIDRLALLEDRFDALAPRLHKRLGELQSDARRETLGVLKQEYDSAVLALDAAVAAVLGPLDRFTTLLAQLDAAGFSAEARGFVTPPPMLNGGIVASHGLLESWRRERERVADAIAAASRPYVAPPAPVTNVVPLRPVEPPAPSLMYRQQQPVKISEPVAPGFTRVEAIRNDVDGGELGAGRMFVRGDQIDLPAAEAARVLRGSAFKYISGAHEGIEGAAE